jgi:hypothetical protein
MVVPSTLILKNTTHRIMIVHGIKIMIEQSITIAIFSEPEANVSIASATKKKPIRISDNHINAGGCVTAKLFFLTIVNNPFNIKVNLQY